MQDLMIIDMVNDKPVKPPPIQRKGYYYYFCFKDLKWKWIKEINIV